jgi:hypothetical protein
VRVAPWFFEAAKDIVHDFLDQGYFVVTEPLELVLAALWGQRAVVLPDEHDRVLCESIRHFNRVHDAPEGLIVAAKIVDLARQVVFNRTPLGRNPALSVFT